MATYFKAIMVVIIFNFNSYLKIISYHFIYFINSISNYFILASGNFEFNCNCFIKFIEFLIVKTAFIYITITHLIIIRFIKIYSIIKGH